MATSLYPKAMRLLKGYPPWKSLFAQFTSGSFPCTVRGPRSGFLALVIAELARRSSSPLLIIVPTEQEAESLLGDLELFDTEGRLFPWWGSMPYRPLPAAAPVFNRRSQVLARALTAPPPVVVCALRAALTPLPDAESFRRRLVTVRKGAAFDPAKLAQQLTDLGYSRVPRVSVRGEFALRGEVLDIALEGEADGVRIVFDFDEIQQIKPFDIASQATSGSLHEVTIFPQREVVWDDAAIARLAAATGEYNEFRHPEQLIDHLREVRRIEGEELYYPLSAAKRSWLLDYLGHQTPVVLVDSERLVTSHESLQKEYLGLFAKERAHREVPRPERILLDLSEIREAIQKRISFSLLPGTDGDAVIELPCDAPRSFFGNIAFLKEELANLSAAGYHVHVYAGSGAQAQRLRHLFSELDLDVDEAGISGGFALPERKLLVIEENEIFGRRKRAPKSVKQVHTSAIDTFVELSPGDHVVHVNYGIGKFNGIKRIAAAGNERDYIHLEYAGEEFIYIPIEQVNLIQRYIGSSGQPPRLDKVGGKAWQNRKEKVRRNVEDLAERLVRLYSRRRRSRGYAFPPDTEWQTQFEAAFPYEETPDQIACIDDVKADMEKPEPMDRLICGDVGYGKTEIALRAAFKAVSAGRQVALLTPTTILTEQHYETFTERFEQFPVKIAMLSRFVPTKDQKRVLADLAGGQVDIVIGTHRVLQKDVRFRDLGLIVVDEEQRFGVKDKERLKELKTSVDSLTLTATPIPRTLHMALLKIRDMSILSTPPNNRLPIQTVIQEFNEELIAEAIRSEVARGGQIFFLHNRIETLDHTQRFIQQIVPEVLVESAHGQLAARELEEIMHRFVHGAFHVLVSTTIIENGIDIPNVNTIIIDRADMYGISQLYQLRGRVGRSDRLAYAYLLYPDKRVLSELAMKRLQIISDYTELGSGFKIALKDLEVRGAGNLLGREQSGDILSVGFDMYLKLLDSAVRKLDESAEPADEEVYLELEYSGYIPDSYISEPVEKMEVYKKIAAIAAEDELESVAGELQDRFGPLPDELNSLLSLAEIRILCNRLHVASMRERRGVLEVEFGKVAKVSADRVVTLIQASGGSVRIDPKRPHVLVMDTGTVGLKEKSEFIRGRLSMLVA